MFVYYTSIEYEYWSQSFRTSKSVRWICFSDLSSNYIMKRGEASTYNIYTAVLSAERIISHGKHKALWTRQEFSEEPTVTAKFPGVYLVFKEDSHQIVALIPKQAKLAAQGIKIHGSS